MNILFSSKIFNYMEYLGITATMAQLVQHPTCVQKVECSNSVLDRPMPFKQVVTVPPPNAWQRKLGVTVYMMRMFRVIVGFVP